MPQQFTVEYQQSRTNLVFNPSFEDAQYFGNTVATTATISTAGAAFGTYSLSLTSLTNSADAEYATPTNQSRVIAGKGYTASIYVRNLGSGTRNMRVGLRFYSVTGSLISEVPSADYSVAVSGSFSRLSLTVTDAPSAAYYASMFIQYQRSGGAVSNSVLVDAFMLEEALVPATYFDPNNDSTSFWTGQAYASPSAILTNNYAVMNDVQQISGFVGRQQVADQFEPSRMSISARYPTGFAAPNVSFRVGSLVRVKRTGSAYTMWTGRIRNVSVEWDKPYSTDTSIGVADYITIECEGALADWGRLQGNNLSVAADDLLTQLSNVLSGTNLQYGTTYTAATAPELSSSQVTDSLAVWLNTACATIGATIKDGSDNSIVGVNGRDFVGNLPVQFSDAANNSTNQVYDSIVFDSVSADFFTQIEINTTAYGDVVVETGVAPFRTYRQTTFNASAAQATDLANYLLGVFGENGFGISEISCKSEAQNSWALDLGYGWWDIIGYTTFITFRGSVFRCTILGSAFTATPSESRFTYYVADIGLTPYLILDDTSAGILDTNKLGW